MGLRDTYSAAKYTFSEFMEDQPFVLSAALSFYALLSLAPLLLVAVAVAGFIFGEQAARGELVNQIGAYVGEDGARVIQTVLTNASQSGQGVISTTIGIVATLIGATTVFGQLQTALNQIWDVKPAPQSSAVWGFLRTRLASLSVVILVGLLLLLLIGVSWGIGVIQNYFPQAIPGGAWLWSGLDFLISLVILSLLVGVIFKALPDARLSWEDVMVGAVITGVLLGIGKFGISVYLRWADVGSAYGSAGSLVVLLIWIYYSALILLFGAELTQVYARRYGKDIEPAEYAVRTDQPEEGEAGEEPGGQDRRSEAA